MTAFALDLHDHLPSLTEVPSLMPEQPRFVRSLDLVALPSAVTVARLFVASTLHHWRARFIEPDVELVVAELVRHSVVTSGVGDDWLDAEYLDFVVVRLVAYERSIVIEVWDTMTEPIELSEHDQITEPTGLALVDARAKNWGFEHVPRGRVVWAELDVYERSAIGLPKRPAKRRHRRDTLEEPVHDHDFLERILDGLRRL